MLVVGLVENWDVHEWPLKLKRKKLSKQLFLHDRLCIHAVYTNKTLQEETEPSNGSGKGTTIHPSSPFGPSIEPPSPCSFFQWAKWFMSSEVKLGPAYESKIVKFIFPTLVCKMTRLTFEYKSPESSTLLLTACSFSRAIKPFVFFTPSHNPTCFGETMEGSLKTTRRHDLLF